MQLLSIILFFYGLFLPTTHSAVYKKPDFYITDLKTSRQSLNYNNYENTVYQKICHYMKELKSLESKNKISQTNRKKFLKEVVKIYDKVLDFSGEHFIMYCVYNYYESAEPTEILNLSKKILSKKKQKKFKRMLKLCDKEQKTGNGDNSKKFQAKIIWKPVQLLSSSDYSSFSPSSRENYIKKIKQSYLQFERNVDEGLFPLQAKTTIFNFLIPSALASTSGKCLIGGVIRDTAYSSKLKRKVCPVYGRNCENRENTFQCGVVFNNKCISINPVRSLSKRCYQASQGTSINPADYASYKKSLENIINQYCKGKRKSWAGCINVRNRVKEINSTQLELNQTADDTPPRSAKSTTSTPSPVVSLPPPAQTEASAPVCDENNCPDTNTGSTFKEIINIQTLLEPNPAYKDMINYFSETVFDNSTCKCQSNDACKRGCKPRGEVKKSESPPVNKCSGKKEIGNSTANCMRHVTSAIMNTVHKYLTKYCEDTQKNESKDSYGQCVNKFTSPSEKNNICKNSFVFPSALCALNLDGQNKESFKNIEDPSVRKKCEAWDLLNQSLTSFPIKKDDGSIENIPLFNKISEEQAKKFQDDTTQIPEGAIVVMQSGSKHGHVEIKTNKKTCGPDKNQACFCSDYCRDRPNYSSGFKVEAVFEFNPRVLEYIQKNI